MKSKNTGAYEIVNQRTFALDYRFGEEFFDLSGRIAKRILEENPEWTFERSADLGCRFSDKSLNLTLTVTSSRIQLMQVASLEVQELLDAATFAGKAETMATRVVKILNLESFSRIGHQATYLYPYANSSESQKALSELAIVKVPDDLVSVCGNIDEIARVCTFVRPDSLLRVSLSGFEQAVALPPGVVQAALVVPHAQKSNQHRILMDKIKASKMIANRPQFGFQIEMDSFVMEPRGISIVDFIDQTESDMNGLRPLLLRKFQ